MTQLFVLDSDYITLLQRGEPQVVEHLAKVPKHLIAASIVTYEEQLRGRLAVVRQAQIPDRLALAYLRLRECTPSSVRFIWWTLTSRRPGSTRHCARSTIGWARWISVLPRRC